MSSMNNPPDLVAVAEMGILSSISLAMGLFILSGMDAWIDGENAARFTIGAAACIFFCLVVIVLTVVTQVILRPKKVEAHEILTLHWRFRGKEAVPFDSISDMAIDPRAPRSMKTKWTGGSMGLRGRRMRFGLSYEIAVAVRQRYFEKFGRYPPSPP
jgi:hypothetical protein